MKKKFRFLSLILTLAMCATLCVPAFAVAPWSLGQMADLVDRNLL